MSQHDAEPDLVEPEGVNAASEEATAETADSPGGRHVRAGGRPEAAPPAEQHDQQSADDEMAGAPGTDPADPGQPEASPGQDSGSGR
jgi:hypothetical protein